jgi:steroid delta-isomerase
MTIAHDRYRKYLETLTLETLPSLPSYVCSNIRFKDPFNDVTGVLAMTRIFQDMFENIGNTVFRVDHMASDQNICLMAWQFQATLRGKPWQFSGTSIITFTPDGMVEKHIDYWDAASDFYKHLPIIGWLLEKLKLRVAVH